MRPTDGWNVRAAIMPFRYWRTLNQARSGISDGRLQSPRSVEQEKIEGEWRCWRIGRFTLGIAQTVRRR